VSAEGYEETMASFARTVGLRKLKAIHLNDAKSARGSRLDRHERAAAFFQSALQAEMMIHGRVGPDSVGTLYSLALAQQKAGNYDAAVSHIELLLDVVAKSPERNDRYFRLNMANVHRDLADLYLARSRAAALATMREASDARPAARGQEAKVIAAEARPAAAPDLVKAREQYRLALSIWEEVMKDDPEALADKYRQASTALWRTQDKTDEKFGNELWDKAEALREKFKTPLRREPIGPPNPGNDPAIQAQLAAEGPGYLLFNRQTDYAYGRPEFVNLIRAVAAEWSKRHPNLKLVIADLSLRGGGNFPGHGGDHQDGREADIWPPTNNGQPEPTNIYAPNYSPELTTELIKLIKEIKPAAVVYFDDPALVSAGLGRATRDHNNHMHFLLP
jgi:tetratricopeptide (TPR) repeat protein